MYEWLLKSYIGFSIVYILFGYIGFSDRLAGYAWFLIPVIIFYPIIKMKSKYSLLWLSAGIAINTLMVIYFDIVKLYRPISLFYNFIVR